MKVELHGDIAITYGRYIAQNRTGGPDKSWFSVWFERVYRKKTGLALCISSNYTWAEWPGQTVRQQSIVLFGASAMFRHSCFLAVGLIATRAYVEQARPAAAVSNAEVSPSSEAARAAADVSALEKKIEDAVVRGDVQFVNSVTSSDFDRARRRMDEGRSPPGF